MKKLKYLKIRQDLNGAGFFIYFSQVYDGSKIINFLLFWQSVCNGNTCSYYCDIEFGKNVHNAFGTAAATHKVVDDQRFGAGNYSTFRNRHFLHAIVRTGEIIDKPSYEEKIKMCEIVTESGADFIKTSTGFSTAGATFADVELFAKHVGPNVKIKAAGGISSMDDAEKFIELGATRLGTSRIVKIVKNEAGSGY